VRTAEPVLEHVDTADRRPQTGFAVAGLFAGIGGIEIGLEKAGHHAVQLCEIDDCARAVLERRFDVPIAKDVTKLRRLEGVDLVSAGFPCQDLSQAGGKRGIRGRQSSLVQHLFRLVRTAVDEGVPPRWVLIENVSYMLRLDRGKAMTYLTSKLVSLGYTWAYRVVDARGLGMPQRRQRVLLLAALDDDPRAVLFADAVPDPESIDEIGPVNPAKAYGFYWTEGRRGLGWAEEAVPTIKGGSRLGIPSPPAVWIPAKDFVGTPTIEDAERLQGFEPRWTEAAVDVQGARAGRRWTLVGNAVCVPMAEWLGNRLADPGTFDERLQVPKARRPWPIAAWGSKSDCFEVDVGMRPQTTNHVPLSGYLLDQLKPLSPKATRGFLSRARSHGLRFSDGFLASLDRHLASAN
jgi:DNA (cytosine-5)-methyltransferase 1